MWKSPALVSCLFLAACTCTSGPAPVAEAPPLAPTAAPSPPTAAPPDAPGPAQGGQAASLEGAWVSPSCGARKYGRRLVFSADGTFTAQDLVSPCPPGVACVWSGIIDRQGTWSKKDGSVTLVVAGDPGPKPGSAEFPLTLTLDEATGVPSETQDGASCAYKR